MGKSQQERYLTVIGRGIVGLAIAFEGVMRGWRVRLVGPSAQQGGAASWAAHGVCSLRGSRYGRAKLFQAKIQASDMLGSWLAQIGHVSGRPIPQIRGQCQEPVRSLEDYLRRRQELFAVHGDARYFRSSLVSPVGRGHGWIQKFLEHTELFGILDFWDDSWYDARAALAALEQALVRRGAERLDEELIGFAPGGKEVLLGSERARSPVTLDCRSGWETIVLAVGASTPALLERLGWRADGQELFEMIGGTTLDFHLSAGPRSWCPPTASVLYLGRERWIFSPEAGVVTAGASSVPAAPGDKAWVQASEEAVRQWAYTRLRSPKSEQIQRVETRSGVRLALRDRRPLLGRLLAQPTSSEGASRRFYVAAGFHRHGLQLAPWLGRTVLDVIEGTPKKEDIPILEAFAPGRIRRIP